MPIATQIFNCTHMLHDLNIDDFKSRTPDCTCASSPLIYNTAANVITGDLKIINNTSLQDVFTNNPKYRESKSINWSHSFKILKDFVKDYARQWAKREKEELYTLSEFCKKRTKKKQCDSTKKFSEIDITNMLKFLIDNIFAMFGEPVFQQTFGIRMGTKCAPLLDHLFLYSYEADYI